MNLRKFIDIDFLSRYIEIFKSSLHEIRSGGVGMGPVRMGRSMGGNRMNPYDRPERPGFGRGKLKIVFIFTSECCDIQA